MIRSVSGYINVINVPLQRNFRVTMTSANPHTITDESLRNNKPKPPEPEVELNLRPNVQMSPPRATAR